MSQSLRFEEFTECTAIIVDNYYLPVVDLNEELEPLLEEHITFEFYDEGSDEKDAEVENEVVEFELRVICSAYHNDQRPFKAEVFARHGGIHNAW